MRLFSWYGLAALATAASCGYLTGVAHHPSEAPVCCPGMPSDADEATAPPGLAMHATIEGVRLDDIDLTCPPNFVLPFDLFLQTNEPPIADPGVHQATYEFPASPLEGPELPTMPYLTDFQTDLDIPIKLESFQYGIPPFSYAPQKNARSATEIALGIGDWVCDCVMPR